jgi:hypothetical protein
VEITAFAPPAEAHARIAYALTELRWFLAPNKNSHICRMQQPWSQTASMNDVAYVEWVKRDQSLSGIMYVL